ncbi:MAG: MaoC/PaaZ C-terminal domain-containing protein, partial [Gemmatimonadota bacterium]
PRATSGGAGHRRSVGPRASVQEHRRARPSHLGSFRRYLTDRISSALSPGEPPERNPRPALHVRGLRVDGSRLRRYVRATNGDQVARYGTHDLLPPSFPAVWETAYLLDLLRLAGYPLPLAGLLHLGGERLHLRPLRASEPLDLRMRIVSAEAIRDSLKITVVSNALSPVGRLCSESELLLLLRGVRLGGGGGSASRREPAQREDQEPEQNWIDLCSWELAGDAGRRYAFASGDVNPIHLSRLTARPFGFKRPILHGYCTEAMVANALITEILGSDPTALRRLSIRFTAPLFLPAQVTLRVDRHGPEARGAFQVVVAGGSRPCAVGEWAGG